MLDLTRFRTYPAAERRNLVTLDDFVRPEDSRVVWDAEGFDRLCGLVHEAAGNGRNVLLQIGAHVIKCGLGLLVGDLMERGFVTHLAMNGACPRLPIRRSPGEFSGSPRRLAGGARGPS